MEHGRNKRTQTCTPVERLLSSERGHPLECPLAYLASLTKVAVTCLDDGAVPPRDSCCFHDGAYISSESVRASGGRFTREFHHNLPDQLLHGLSKRRGQLKINSFLFRSVMRLFHFAKGSPPAALPRFVTSPIPMRYFGLVPELLRDNLILRAVFQLVARAIVEQRNR